MSRKRRNSSSSIESDSTHDEVSQYTQSDSDGDVHPSEDVRPRVDTATGQTGAFPGLGDQDEPFYGPALDGLDYLRMVRSERRDIPHLLSSTQRTNWDEPDMQYGGFYDDGAYTAKNLEKTIPAQKFAQPQLYYYNSLLAHFEVVRTTLRCTPPRADIQGLDKTRLVSFPASNKTARDAWQVQLLHKLPHPVQLACIDGDSVMEIVRTITRRMTHFFRSQKAVDIDRTGAWLWGVLGRCPDRGQLGSEEISDLRALARKAVEVTRWLKQRDGLYEAAAVEDESADDVESSDEARHSAVQQTTIDQPITVSKTTETLSENEDAADNREPLLEKKLMILDMVITVIGEVYGQKDLLDLRETWIVCSV